MFPVPVRVRVRAWYSYEYLIAVLDASSAHHHESTIFLWIDVRYLYEYSYRALIRFFDAIDLLRSPYYDDGIITTSVITNAHTMPLMSPTNLLFTHEQSNPKSDQGTKQRIYLIFTTRSNHCCMYAPASFIPTTGAYSQPPHPTRICAGRPEWAACRWDSSRASGCPRRHQSLYRDDLCWCCYYY